MKHWGPAALGRGEMDPPLERGRKAETRFGSSQVVRTLKPGVLLSRVRAQPLIPSGRVASVFAPLIPKAQGFWGGINESMQVETLVLAQLGPQVLGRR